MDVWWKRSGPYACGSVSAYSMLPVSKPEPAQTKGVSHSTRECKQGPTSKLRVVSPARMVTNTGRLTCVMFRFQNAKQTIFSAANSANFLKEEREK